MFSDQSLSHFPVLSSSAFQEITSSSQVHPQLSCFVYMCLYDLQHLTGTAYMSSVDRRLFIKEEQYSIGISMIMTTAFSVCSYTLPLHSS